MNRNSGFPRRHALAAIGAGVGALAMPRSAMARRSSGLGLDPATPKGRRTAYMLMRGALDERLVIGCVSGQYYGVVDAELTPLFGFVSATFARYRQVPSGDFDVVNVEYFYFTDPLSGKAMGSFRNPYTGETVQVPAGGYAPTRFTITRELDLRLGRTIPGMAFEHRVGPLEVRGDDVWFTEVTRTGLAVAPGARPFRYSESTTLHARRRDLLAPGIKRVRCETGFTNVVGWRPWLKMGDRPGHMMAIGAGSYGASLADLPAAWLEATRRDHPELIADPVAVLAPLWNAK